MKKTLFLLIYLIIFISLFIISHADKEPTPPPAPPAVEEEDFSDADSPPEELVSTLKLIDQESKQNTITKKKTSSQALQKYTCLNSQICHELDDVWVRIRDYITVDEDYSTQIYDPTTGKWRKYEELYPPPPQKTLEESGISSTPSADCLKEVKKLEQAAKDMASWKDQNEQCTLTEYYKGGKSQSINLQYPCGYGFPEINSIKATCPNPNGCCGTYVWNIYNLAIKKYGLNVKWPIVASGKLDHGPNNVKSGYLKITLNSWGKDGNYKNANFKPNQLMPGDMVYYVMKRGMYGKCPKIGTTHINIVGLPRDSTNTIFNVMDSKCKKNGVCKTTTNFPDFFNNNYCTGQDAAPMSAGESWIYVYRVIPACIAATPPEIRAKFSKIGLS